MQIIEARDQVEFDALIRKGHVVRDGVGMRWQRCGECLNIGAPLADKLKCCVCERERVVCADCAADATAGWRCDICAFNAQTHR